MKSWQKNEKFLKVYNKNNKLEKLITKDEYQKNWP